MFSYSQGRLHSKCFSFAIPENISINPEPPSTTGDLIEFISQNNTYRITITIEPSFEGTRYELEQYISEDAGGTPLEKIEPVTINELPGHQLLYQGGNFEEYQIRLLHGTCEFVLHISTKKPNSIKSIVESEKVAALINSIRAQE